MANPSAGVYNYVENYSDGSSTIATVAPTGVNVSTPYATDRSGELAYTPTAATAVAAFEQIQAGEPAWAIAQSINDANNAIWAAPSEPTYFQPYVEPYDNNGIVSYVQDFGGGGGGPTYNSCIGGVTAQSSPPSSQQILTCNTLQPTPPSRGGDVSDLSWFQQLARAAANVTETSVALAYVIAVGGTCNTRAGMLLECFVNSTPGGPQMTVGNVILNQQRNPETNAFVPMNADVLAHESAHATQWAVLGPAFAVEYGVAYGIQGQCNIFEQLADYQKGGYRQCLG